MENKQYHIISLGDSNFLVITKGWVRPGYYLEDIAHDLSSLGEISNVYFDFLLKNGPKDRFYKAVFSKADSTFKSIVRIDADKEIEDKADDFLSKNFDLVSDSYLTNAQKFLLKKKLTVSN
jgi:hypothetical protein